METDLIPSGGEPPLAKICGIQFGLMTTDDVYKLSVYATENPLTKAKDLDDSKLGHPIAKGPCGTCNGETVEQCQGHFAHCNLPTPVFHPHHVGKLITLLRKICLNCGQPKRKSPGKLASLLAPGLKKHFDQNATLRPKVEVEGDISAPTDLAQRASTSHRHVVDDCYDYHKDDVHRASASTHKKRKLTEVYIDVEARDSKRPAEESGVVILLSSDDEGDISSSSRKQLKVQSDRDDDEKGPETPSTPNSPARRTLRKRKKPTEFSATPATGSVINLTHNIDMWNPLSVTKSGKRKRVENGKDSQPSGVTIVDLCHAKPAVEKTKAKRGKCKYCSGAHPDRYPEVLIKMEVTERGKEKHVCKGIKMELKTKKSDGLDSVALDYWSFVAGKSSNNGISVRRSRALLPFEALKILKKIPESAMTALGMHPEVARPEALIVECVPVPPNCTRIGEDVRDITNLNFKQGSDRATQIFNKLLNKINGITKSRFGKPVFQAAHVEACELQSLFGQYLREKGAPKAVPGKEKKRIDHGGRLQKKDSRWSLDWLKKHVLGKRSGYSARNVVTGDPYLRVEEIGFPQQIAKYVTVPERVNRLNMEKLQEYVNNGQSLVGRYRACGAVRLVRGSERLEVTRRTSHELQIGDIVHRHLKDGDLVYVNRPPSLHKHSLLALRVHIQDLAVFAINPAICAPLHGDFDGDCLHVFVPQSEEAKAELQQLMIIPEQLLPSPDGNTIIGMSQDNILATHLLTATPVFLTKEEMYQMAMWSTRRLPIPAILKSVRGPMWAGKQVIDLTIPEDFSITSNDGSVDIRDGELMSYSRKDNWLTNTNGLMRALAQYSPFAAVEHLDCSQSALREWLLSRGFSVSLRDFYAAPDQQSRRKMIEELMDSVNYSQNMAVNKELIFDEKFQKLDAIQSDMDMGSTGEEVLEDIAVAFFQQQFKEIGEEFGSKICDDNQLFAMVRSGSKGSLSKVLQQIGTLGLQLYRGEHLLKLAGNAKLNSLAASVSCEARWEARGLVRNSLLDGLNPLEFYLHAIAVRADLLRKSVDVTEPGELFKKLMLFLRDVHVSYDGTVRNKGGLEIIQFSYDDAKNPKSKDTTDGKDSVLPGEAVGILAATAIAQPAYQVMMDAGHNVGSKKIRPLALLQDTLFPRSGGKLKAADRRTTLRLNRCLCNTNFCEEKRALHIQDELQPVSVELVAKAMSIQYVPENSSDWSQFIEDGVKLRLPWVGHIQFDKKALIQINLKMDRIMSVLEAAFDTKSYAKIMSNNHLGNPVFFSRFGCGCMGARIDNDFGPCLLFSANLKSKISKRMASRSNEKVLEFVDALRDVMMPLILKTIVKGDERIASAKLVWEDAAWSPYSLSDDGERIPPNPNGELVVEVVVQEKLSTSRGSPWSIMKEACAHIDTIDWKRSSPYSVQEIRHCLGVEAARDCILQRLNLATKAGGSFVSNTHLKLVSDLMVYSGDVNGITHFGYRDLMRSLKTSAPFTGGAFRAPIKTFMDAGEKGDEEFLSGVLASSIFGKRVPVGTGADFSLQLQPKVILDNMQLPMQSVDILDCLGKLNSKIKEEFPETPVAVDEFHVDGDTNEWGDTNVNGGWGASPADAGGWGASPQDAGGWGNGSGVVAKTSDPEEGGWGGSSSPVQANGWGDSPLKTTAGGWEAPDAGDEGGWGDAPLAADLNTSSSLPSKHVDAGNWDAVDGETQETEPDINRQATIAMDGWGSDIATDKEHTNDVGWDAVEAIPAASDGWVIDEPLPDAHGTGAWCSVPEDMPRSRSESSGRPLRNDEPREFKPTGANTIPLGKQRHFGSKIVGAGTDSVNTSPARLSLDSPIHVRANDGAEVPEPGWEDQDGDAVADGWTLTAVEGGNDSGWATLERPTSAGNLRSPVGHRSEGTPGWSPGGGWQKDGSGQHGSGRTRNGMAPRRLDDRKDSKDWDEIVETVRFVRNILQTYEPEQRLKDEVHEMLMTQVLRHHPSSATKVGCGVDYFKVAYYKTSKPSDRPSKCFFLVRTDGTQDDFSYHKCLKTLASKKNPRLDDLYVTAFIARKQQ